MASETSKDWLIQQLPADIRQPVVNFYIEKHNYPLSEIERLHRALLEIIVAASIRIDALNKETETQ